MPAGQVLINLLVFHFWSSLLKALAKFYSLIYVEAFFSCIAHRT